VSAPESWGPIDASGYERSQFPLGALPNNLAEVTLAVAEHARLRPGRRGSRDLAREPPAGGFPTSVGKMIELDMLAAGVLGPEGAPPSS
jgi:hypothetical protein